MVSTSHGCKVLIARGYEGMTDPQTCLIDFPICHSHDCCCKNVDLLRREWRDTERSRGRQASRSCGKINGWTSSVVAEAVYLIMLSSLPMTYRGAVHPYTVCE
jgi:hypothetical protein